ncbi:acid-sensing ion channel 1C-like [Salvelinus alpinus]|uniref:acid-sensing ion channel 1C-like n=1 Tax=Salvelinus alpinus TaxID=8036 RepID=UPI0039FBE990
MKGDSEESIESIRPSNLQAFANMSTLHGMSHIFAYGHMTFRRFLWTLSFLGSLALLMLVCMDRVSYYFEYPHVTKLDEVAAPNLTFPAVTFCNLNEFRFSQITRNDLYHVGELLALLNSNYQIANTHLAEPEVLDALKDKANFLNFKPKQFNMTDFYNRTGHDINDMLLHCTFRGSECYPWNFTTVTAILAADLGLGTLAMGPKCTGNSGSAGQAGDSGSAGVKDASGSSRVTSVVQKDPRVSKKGHGFFFFVIF